MDYDMLNSIQVQIEVKTYTIFTSYWIMKRADNKVDYTKVGYLAADSLPL